MSALTASSYIESLSMTLLKNLESSNTNSGLMNSSLSMDPLNSLSAILNTKHDISHVQEAPSLFKTPSTVIIAPNNGPNRVNVKNLVSETQIFQNTLLNSDLTIDANLSSSSP